MSDVFLDIEHWTLYPAFVTNSIYHHFDIRGSITSRQFNFRDNYIFQANGAAALYKQSGRDYRDGVLLNNHFYKVHRAHCFLSLELYELSLFLQKFVAFDKPLHDQTFLLPGAQCLHAPKHLPVLEKAEEFFSGCPLY